MAVIISLFIFAVALVRINKVVKGMNDAFPRQTRIVIHFGLVICVLFFNIVNFVEFTFKYSFESSCSTSLNIAYYIFAIDTWIWDCFELACNMLLLYIVSSSTDSLTRSESSEGSSVQSSDYDSGLDEAAKQHRK